MSFTNRILFLLCFFVFIGIVLSSSYKVVKKFHSKQLNNEIDTSFYVRELNNELAGGNYRKGGIIFQPIINQDTLGFVVYFSESKSGKCALEFRKINYKCSHRVAMFWLSKIIPEIKKSYTLDSLKSIYLGRLISNGDLAIQVTKQYRKRFGKSNVIAKYSTVFDFFLTSQIAIDFNRLLNPYELKVKKITAEKIFFGSQSECKRYSIIESDSTQMPLKILDGMVYINVSK
ncbi:MAG: hypothetical protein HYU67_09570 [Flavobacteriia bacterium]|nr:hypothetical protein [Flavobacteriia bacterium]